MRNRRKTDSLAPLARQAMLVALLLAVAVLAGCDTAEFDRIRERSRVNEEFRLACLPYGKEQVLVAWNKGQLVCWRYTPSAKGRQVEVERRVVAVAEEVL